MRIKMKRFLGILLTLTLVLGLMPGMSLTAYAADATTLATDTTTWENGDYVVPEGGVTISGHITVNGIVNLTLTEGATLTANMGITLSDGATINVSGEGAMVVKGSNGNANSTVAGTGTLVLKSGTVTVTGGTAAKVAQYGTSSNAGGVAVNGSVTVNGGILNATGGVGGSLSSHTVDARAGAGGTAISGNVTVNAGTVTATGGNGGSDAAYAMGARAGAGGVAIGGDATINGGTWAATYGSAGAKGPSEDGMPADGTVGAGGASYNGTLTLGANVKLYEGTEANEEKLLDGNDSDSRVYSGEKKASMYANGPDISQGPDKTALNDAITAAETLYDSIKDNTDYADIANTFQTAINTAKGVAYSDEVDQDAVDTATTNIITANTNAVIGIINALPAASDVTTADREVIETVREAYDALDAAQKALVDANTLKKLTDAEAALATIDQTAAGNVNTAIGNLPAATDVTADSRADIKAAREAYDALDDAQKALVDVDTLKKLTDAEEALAAIDQAAAGNAITAIENLPAVADVTVESREAIEAARKAYDALDEAQKKLVDEDTLKKLADTEKALKDAEIAKSVTDTINALPASDKVATTDKAAIEAARKAYDALTADQKKKVSADTLKKLTDAETALTAAEKKAAEEEAAKKKEEADTKAANAVVETINKLPVSNKVATTDKAAIEAARKAYDALSADQKKKVSADTLKKLTDAETALKAAEKKAAEDKAAAEKKAAEEKAARELAAAKEEAQAAMNEQVTVTQKGKKFTVKWKKSSAADGYYVYAQYCGKKITKPAKTIAKNTTTKTTITKINGKKINQKKQFRVYVVPYKIIDGKKVALGKSTVAHLVGAKSTKYSNVKKLTLTKKKYTVKVGKTAKIKANVTLVNKNKKHIPKGHGAKFRYKSSDTSIATVDKNGKIKGIKKGTCTIYVYSINGLMKKAKVTIK